MGTDRKPRLGKNLLQGLLLIDEQVPRAAADENLDAGGPSRLLQFGQVRRRRADVEAVVHQALLSRQGQLRVQRLDGDRGRLCVGHLQEARHAPFRARPAGRVQILLVREPRFPEMHLVVDHARNQVQPRRINHFVCGRMQGRIHGDNLAVFDQNVRAQSFLGQDDSRMADKRLHNERTFLG